MAYVMVQSRDAARYSVYVVDWWPKADLVVYETDSRVDAGCCEQYWKFTTSEVEATVGIAFVKDPSSADLVIGYTKHRHEAGWRDSRHPLKGKLR